MLEYPYILNKIDYMYLDKLYYKNVGPIEELDLVLSRNAQNNPKPVVFVGKNGSGKSILLSNIVDAFYEIATKVFNNATKTIGVGHQYYKEISPIQIRLGQTYMISYLVFQENGNIEYIFKSGNLEFNTFKTKLVQPIDNRLNWENETNFKGISVINEQVKKAFEENIVCFFGPNRYMKPNWMGEKYMTEGKSANFSVYERYNNKLRNPINVQNIANQTLQWLFDVIADSRPDFFFPPQSSSYAKNSQVPLSDLILLLVSKNNIEKLMSAILGDNIEFQMKNRSFGNQRFAILNKTSKQVVIPSLDSLSTGQLALFHLFATIIRYADTENLNLSHRLQDISGIVVIDEIELHLHAQLQAEVLPRLIKLFPKVQFIITSHSPLFLLGMQEEFGKDGFDIFELPTGKKITAEEFSEFKNAYEHIVQTSTYQKQIQEAIDSKLSQPLVVTEGPTDWMHIKAAKRALGEQAEYNWIKSLKFDFLEYKTVGQTGSELKDIAISLEMGNDTLLKMCEQYSKLPQPRKIIFIADCDDEKIKNAFTHQGSFKDWGNNVFSMCLPVPDFRKETPAICIEHLYTDHEIKQEVVCNGNIRRRLFMGNEFDENGFLIEKERTYWCHAIRCCGPGKIGIIDGCGDKRVLIPTDSAYKNINFALSKTDFAINILHQKVPFDKMNFSNFIPIFEQIRSILQI